MRGQQICAETRSAARVQRVTDQPLVELHVVSDSTGETAARLVSALEAQFPDTQFDVVRHPRVEDVDDLQLAVSRTKGRPAVMVYTLVDMELRETMRRLCRRARLHYCDLLGHPIDAVARVSGQAAKMESGRRHPLDSQYFKRMEAIEFAVKFDDGVGAGLRDADIVLVGVSRTSKTPLSMYLAQRGYKTGNVPIVPGIDPPRALLELDPKKVFALTIDPSSLLTIRQARVRALGAPPYSTYADPEALIEEVRGARRLYRDQGWQVVDISGRAAEENAARILRMIEERE
jgi:regulator of PEP synthase PpsR (kinase-PPPase family)